MTNSEYVYPTYAKFIHLGMAMFGIAAYLTGELADDGRESTGYLLHAYLGLSLAMFMVIRALSGLFSASALSFKNWFPFSRQQWQLTLEDIGAMLRFRLPSRDHHQGLAGFVQAFGLIVFTWMAVTGTGLFLLGGGKEGDLFELIEEVHEVGESLIPLYLMLHIGAVMLHTLHGSPVWKRMFSLK